MSWTETNDKEIQEYLVRLKNKQKEIQPILNHVEIIINNTRNIQTKIQTSYTVDKGQRIQRIVKLKPKDKWGDEMTDEYRLEVKNEILVKINELLGEPDE